LNYIAHRCQVLDLEDSLCHLNCLPRKKISLRSASFQSSQFGKTEGSYLPIIGRVVFDVLPEVKGITKLKSYSLNSVASDWLHETKRVCMLYMFCL
jgi:DNA polymerase elongation subunit (family B)